MDVEFLMSSHFLCHRAGKSESSQSPELPQVIESCQFVTLVVSNLWLNTQSQLNIHKTLSAVTIEIIFPQIQRKCPVDIPQLFLDVLVMNWLCCDVCLQSWNSPCFLEQNQFPAVLLHLCHSIPNLKEALSGTRQWGIAWVGVAVVWIFAVLQVDTQGVVVVFLVSDHYEPDTAERRVWHTE